MKTNGHEQEGAMGAQDEEEQADGSESPDEPANDLDEAGELDETETSEQSWADPVELLLRGERRRRRQLLRIHPAVEALVLLIVFALGLGSGYVAWGMSPAGQERRAAAERASLTKQVNPAEGFTLPVKYGDIGPKVIAAGGIDQAKFEALYRQNGKPLTDAQLGILRGAVNSPIVVDRENSYFLLNFFWAIGLTNKNAILEQGPMMQGGKAQVGNFASTGGWTVGAKESTALYSSAELIKLSGEQQARVEEVSKNAYRPCCGNPTYFPDCNHGMALLGLLELMASQGATVDQMYTAAKQVNAFWFPDQMLEVATYVKAIEGKDFSAADPKRVLSAELFSSKGYQQVFKQLAERGLIPQQSGNGSSCGV